jgi:hypothetical protein
LNAQANLFQPIKPERSSNSNYEVHKSSEFHQVAPKAQLTSYKTEYKLAKADLQNVDVNNNYTTKANNKPITVVYRNRSNSSTFYDNNMKEIDNNEDLENFNNFKQKLNASEKQIDSYNNYANKSHYLTHSASSTNNSKSNNEKNIRNGVYIDINLIKELNSKKPKAQFVSICLKFLIVKLFVSIVKNYLFIIFLKKLKAQKVIESKLNKNLFKLNCF